MKDWNYENEQWTKLPYELKHLPLFTRQMDLISLFFRSLFAIVLKFWFFRFYIFLRVKGDFKAVRKHYPKLILISNHSSHLDATSIAAAVPYRYWLELYITAAKDYFFSNPVFTFFSKHCLGAIPVDRKDRTGQAIDLCVNLLTRLPAIWLIMFPEGTRSPDGYIQTFRRGVSLFAERTNTPILFLYLEGSSQLWPKGNFFAKPGILTLHIGPVHPPGPIQQIHEAYQSWVKTVNPAAYKEESVEKTRELGDLET